MSKKKFVMIGANSYIARNLIYILRKNNNADLYLYDYHDNHADNEPNYSKIDVLSADSVKSIDFDCDAVFLFTGKTGTADGFNNPRDYVMINELSLLNVLNEYRRQQSNAKLIFPSTRLIYKGSNDDLSEDSEKEFKSIYAINKLACENYILLYHQMFGVKYCILRICVPYGSDVDEASSYGTAEFMISSAKKGKNITIYGDGSQRRTLTHISDVCSTIIDAAVSDKCVNDVYNIGGENYSLIEMAQLIANNFGVSVDHIDWPKLAYEMETGSTVFNSDKLDNLIGKHDKIKFADWTVNNQLKN